MGLPNEFEMIELVKIELTLSRVCFVDLKTIEPMNHREVPNMTVSIRRN